MIDSKEPTMVQTDVLVGQVIAVTGAESGYGRLASMALAAAGAHVVLVGEQSDVLAGVASAIENPKRVIIPLKAKVSVSLDWQNTQDRIMDIFGVLHGVVHSANMQSHTPFSTLTENEWTEMFDYNVKSSISIAQIICRRKTQTWLTLIGPHLSDQNLQAYPQREALRGLVEYGQAENLRINMILPSRENSGNITLDKAVAQSVTMLADPNSQHIVGNVLTVHLPEYNKDPLKYIEQSHHPIRTLQDHPYESLLLNDRKNV